MKKILIVISSLKNGGAERAVSNLTVNFPEDWDIDILLNNTDNIDYPYRGKLLSLELNGKNKMSSLFFHFKLLCRRIKKLRELKKTGEYIACISFMDSANVANILSGNKYAKVIGSVRISIRKCGGMLPQYKYTVYPLIRLLYNRADAIVAVSSGIYTELVDDFKLRDNKVVTIENGYDIPLLNRQADEPWDEEDARIKDKKLIVTAGRLSDQKGQWHLIRAFREVLKKEKDAMLLILGTGPLEGYLKKVADDCNIQDKVVLKGFVKNPYKYIAKADIFILPSLFEGYPNAMAEAICLGVPCIASDFQTGAREILAPELVSDRTEIRDVYPAQYGILTPVCSGKQYEGKDELEIAEVKMADAIELLLSDEEMRKKYVYKSVERSKDLGIENVIQKWIQLLK